MHSHRRCGVLLAASLLASPAIAQTQRLNDSGQIACYNANISGVTGTVSAGTPDPESAGFDEQDCTQGLAAADAVGVLPKIGGSTRPGADYTRIANNGSELPADAALGSGPGDWACTRDNRTGLIWEIKVDLPTNLRHRAHTYTWYDTNAAINGGRSGTLGDATTCNSTLSNCNTTAYRDAVNALGLCGANDWRLPSADELLSLVHFGLASGARIDTTWFPNAPAINLNNFGWSGQSTASDPDFAWLVNFGDGDVGLDAKETPLQVRLVRGAP